MNKRMLHVAWIVLSIMLMAHAAFAARQEIVLSTAINDQQAPAVSGSIVVWEDRQSGTWDIAYRDLSVNPPVTRTLNTTGEDRYPSIWGTTVVWQAKQPGWPDWDISAASIVNPSNPFLYWIDISSEDQQYPAVCGDLVVYQDHYFGDWDISAMDISNPANPLWLALIGTWESELYPAVWGRMIIYQSNTWGDWDLFARDVDDPNKASSIIATWNEDMEPAIHGNWLVWQDDNSGQSDIFADYVPDPFSARKAVCAREDSDAQHPAIWNNVVVWQDNRNGNWDIYAYNLATKKESRITEDTSDQTYPAISFSEELGKYVVVWQDKRNGNFWDIYGALVDGAEVAGCVSPSTWDVNADAVVDNKDVVEVQENLGTRNGISPSDGNP